MKIQKLSVVALMLSAVYSGTVFADQAADKKFTDYASYAVGALFANDLKSIIESQKDVITYDNQRVLAGIKDVLDGKINVNENEEIRKTLQAMDEKLKVASQEKAAEQAKKAKEEGDKFVAEFKKKDGVKETKSGLLYRVEKAGEGAEIKASDAVKVHYTGKLPNGDVFDSSVERGQPVEFPLDRVIAGWTEGLQLVKKGGKIELVIPPSLGYGEQGAGAQIPPNATLHFDVEVLDVNPSDNSSDKK